MSKLCRSLKRSMKVEWVWWDYVSEFIDRRFPPDWWYTISNFTRNLPRFIRLAWMWQNWNGYSTLEAFTDLLKENARVVGSSNWHKNSKKEGRRLLGVAQALSNAYNKNNDKSVTMYLFLKYGYCFGQEGGIFQHWPEKAEKLYRYATQKEDELESARKKEAWAKLQKHFERFTD